MYQKKMGDYAPYQHSLARRGIRYKPLAFSCYGRAHPEALATLTAIAKQTARRRGLPGHEGILRRTLAGVAVEIWKRAAAMVRACLPRDSVEEHALLLGVDPAGADAEAQDLERSAPAARSLVRVAGPSAWWA